MSSVLPIGTPAAELAEELARPQRVPAPQPGVYCDVPIAQYLAWDAVTSRTLAQVMRSPAHARAYQVPSVDTEREPSLPLIIGEAMHCALIEPDAFTHRYVKGPPGNWSNKGPKDAKAALQAQYPDAVVLKPNKYDAVQAAVRTLLAHPTVAEIIADTVGREMSVVWDDTETGVCCKARPDILLPGWGAIADLKTTIDASPQGFARSVANFAYDLKAAFYLEFNKSYEHFVIIAAETFEPFACSVYHMEPATIEAARECNRRLLRIWAECAANDDWPGYRNDIMYIGVPDWRLSQLEQAR